MPFNPHRAPFDPLVSTVNNWFYSHARTTGLGPAFVNEALGIAIIIFLPLMALRFGPSVVGRTVLGAARLHICAFCCAYILEAGFKLRRAEYLQVGPHHRLALPGLRNSAYHGRFVSHDT